MMLVLARWYPLVYLFQSSTNMHRKPPPPPSLLPKKKLNNTNQKYHRLEISIRTNRYLGKTQDEKHSQSQSPFFTSSTSKAACFPPAKVATAIAFTIVTLAIGPLTSCPFSSNLFLSSSCLSSCFLHCSLISSSSLLLSVSLLTLPVSSLSFLLSFILFKRLRKSLTSALISKCSSFTSVRSCSTTVRSSESLSTSCARPAHVFLSVEEP
mmetsp:Transcript_4067/g.8954  ORF Transcript_4067/g.8954 Transcript_4067/m.8954 type:complete len:210 (+) Transcript_4067:263-892(+)